jgi:hypothetical protein
MHVLLQKQLYFAPSVVVHMVQPTILGNKHVYKVRCLALLLLLPCALGHKAAGFGQHADQVRRSFQAPGPLGCNCVALDV